MFPDFTKTLSLSFSRTLFKCGLGVSQFILDLITLTLFQVTGVLELQKKFSLHSNVSCLRICSSCWYLVVYFVETFQLLGMFDDFLFLF